MKGLYNDQGRKSGGYRKLVHNLRLNSEGKLPLLSIQCFESRHSECNGIVQSMGMFRGGTICGCKCHEL